jgi:hypothetical protein
MDGFGAHALYRHAQQLTILIGPYQKRDTLEPMGAENAVRQHVILEIRTGVARFRSSIAAAAECVARR